MASLSKARCGKMLNRALRSYKNTALNPTKSAAVGGTINCDTHRSEIAQKMAFSTYSGDNRESSAKEWSNSMSFTSPEADFTSQALSIEETEMLQKAFNERLQKKEELRNDVAYTMSHAASGNVLNPFFMDLLDDRMKAQLENTRSLEQTSLSEHVNERELSLRAGDMDFDIQREEERSESPLFNRRIFYEEPLPGDLQEASAPDDSRAIVVTEAKMPFRIVSVNHSWENLCGYSQDECKGLTLECIQGEETNKAAITALMAQLLKGEEAGTLLTNYSKEGRKFHNRLRVGPLKNSNGKTTHFVGVLKEVNEIGEHFDGAMMHA
jgi:PAS domain S-box-containing protein